MSRTRRPISAYGYLECKECGQLRHITEFYRNDQVMWIECRQWPLSNEELMQLQEEGNEQEVLSMDKDAIAPDDLQWFGRPQSKCKECQSSYLKDRYQKAAAHKRLQQLKFRDDISTSSLFARIGNDDIRQMVEQHHVNCEAERARWLKAWQASNDNGSEPSPEYLEYFEMPELKEQLEGEDDRVVAKTLRAWYLHRRMYDAIEADSECLW